MVVVALCKQLIIAFLSSITTVQSRAFSSHLIIVLAASAVFWKTGVEGSGSDSVSGSSSNAYINLV